MAHIGIELPVALNEVVQRGLDVIRQEVEAIDARARFSGVTPELRRRFRSFELRALGVTTSEVNLMIAVAENEGRLDAINTWDNAFLSFGMFQWTLGTGGNQGELPALLRRLQNEDPAAFPSI